MRALKVEIASYDVMKTCIIMVTAKKRVPPKAGESKAQTSFALKLKAIENLLGRRSPPLSRDVVLELVDDEGLLGDDVLDQVSNGDEAD